MKLPAGPTTPGIFQTLEWIANPFTFMEKCAQRYGDIFTVLIGNNFKPIVFVSNPAALQEMFSDPKHFDAPGHYNGLLEPLLGKQSVILISGDRHKRQRQLMMPPFHGERMRAYGELISAIAAELTREWSINQPFSVRETMQKISLRVIVQAVFGLSEGTRYQQLEDLLSQLLDSSSSPLSVAFLYFPILRRYVGPLSPWGKFLRLKAQTDELIYQEIQERRNHPDPERTDILSLLMSARDEEGQPMTDEELHNELMTLLVAGHETTATAMTWALYWIHQLPQVREKLLAELDSLGENPDLNAIARLPYLNAVCSETLRIYPVAMLTFPRVVQSPRSLAQFDLEPDTLLLGSIYLTHHREDLYPEPKQFKPERFLERQFSPYEYLPFGGGSRRCIGMAFAQFEMKVILATILLKYDITLADQRPVYPVRRGLTASPSEVRLQVKGLRSPQKVENLTAV